MKPISKAMTAVLGTLIATTTACAELGSHGQQAGIAASLWQPRVVAVTADGFVLRSAVPSWAEPKSAPVTADQIPVGSGTHIDARLLSRPAGPIQETPYAHP